MDFSKDIAIIGIGRVGLPLSLSLAEVGFSVIGVDINSDVVKQVNNKKMPFNETGCDELIKQSNVEATENISRVSEARNIIITVGTPLMGHIETDLSQITKVIEGIVPHLKKGQNIILRSTIAPKTTDFVKKYIEMKTGFVVGQEFFLSFCPERIAEGKALEEIRVLPQIIGSEDDESYNRAAEVFSRLTATIFRTTYVSAELVKLFNNISRYIDFAVANQFAIIADNYGQNINEIINMTNYQYPRAHIKKPGFTAGTCLRKDFGMINENIPYSDLLLSAWKVNEFMPKFLVQNMLKRTEIYGKTVGVLGFSFKNDTDDTRDSLSPKLVRYLEREVPKEIKIHDPYLEEIIDGKYRNFNIEDALKDCQILYIATNHKQFKEGKMQILEKLSDDTYIVDIWDVFEHGELFYKVGDIR